MPSIYGPIFLQQLLDFRFFEANSHFTAHRTHHVGHVGDHGVDVPDFESFLPWVDEEDVLAAIRGDEVGAGFEFRQLALQEFHARAIAAHPALYAEVAIAVFGSENRARFGRVSDAGETRNGGKQN